tara:strand:+ start:379 stop:516 length:138 start_codon:yes stop_codon:yes gene_type:complete
MKYLKLLNNRDMEDNMDIIRAMVLFVVLITISNAIGIGIAHLLLP